MKMVKIGIDLLEKNLSLFQNKRIGLIINQASLDSRLQGTFEVFRSHDLNVCTLFGPQHGLFGHTQDNMIEWSEGDVNRAYVEVFSLYGEHRKPTSDMLQDLDMLIFDIPDVGARYYTFIWTMALSMEAALEADLEFVILDRPNPINGLDMEGPILNMDFRSFVGLYPLPVRHGMTPGEIALWMQKEYFSELKMEIISLEGWNRSLWYDDTGLTWTMPSPNMPHLDTAIVYPGQCLLEATNISEGRGTTRPFEIFGAPWIDAYSICNFLNKNCEGAVFQPWYFQPTFHKYSGEICQGAFIHVTDRNSFKPLATTMTILSYIREEYFDFFQLKDPPYEYEYEKLPLDILLGDEKWRHELNNNHSFRGWSNLWQDDQIRWLETRKKYLLY